MSKQEKFIKLRKSEWKDKLKGGKADKKSPKDFDKQALAQGTRHESEHTKDKKLAMEIAMDHLTEDPKYYSKLKQIEKSEGSYHHFKDTQSTVDAQVQTGAELTASPELIQYLTASVNADLAKVRLAKGILTISKKEEGLYSGFFQDNDGQVTQEFLNMTIPILAKTLEMKNLYERPPVPEVAPAHDDVVEDVRLINDALATHNALYHQGQAPGEPIKPEKGYVRIKYGNFELEIKKSMHDFVKAHKANQPQSTDIKKALSLWRRNSKSANLFRTDIEAAQALVADWDQYGEEFNQALFIVQMRNEKR